MTGASLQRFFISQGARERRRGLAVNQSFLFLPRYQGKDSACFVYPVLDLSRWDESHFMGININDQSGVGL